MAAGCSLEESVPPDQFASFRAKHPDHIALSYINCSAAVKALSDIIVTSSSAEKIISQLPRDQKIIFGPDRHLGAYLNRVTGRDMLLWPRSEEHTSELQSLMRTSYAVFCLKKKNINKI